MSSGAERLTFMIDQASGLITVRGKGMWTPAEVELFFRDLERAILTIRREQGSAGVLVDLREAPVQVAETVTALRHWTGRVYQAADRVAVVCATALVAMQVKRAADVATLSTFQAIEPALRWIKAR